MAMSDITNQRERDKFVETEEGKTAIRTQEEVESSRDDIKTEGNQPRTMVNDDEARVILGQILKQLKIMNMHLSYMTDLSLYEKEVDV